MTTAPIPDRLKALRERAGLSIARLATALGMATSSYNHYERPSRFKEPFLPMAFALQLADALAAHGIDRAETLALAGAAPSARPAPPPGMQEDAAIYLYRDQPVPAGDQRLTLRAVFGEQAAQPATYRINAALPGLGLWPGDVVVVDLRRKPRDGELAIIGLPDGSTGVRRVMTPWLLACDPATDATPLRTDQADISIRFAVIGSIRGLT